jgi:hypothetical protein
VFQAPIFGANISGLPPAIGFAETLMRLGFLHPPTLTSLCRAWRNLVQILAPQLILFDHAPTGLLATRGLPGARALFGSSFSIPPQTSPMPIYRWWKGEPLARVLASERMVLAGANATLARLNAPPMARLADLLDVDESIICAAEEFDQYPARTVPAIGAPLRISTKAWRRSGPSWVRSAFSRTSSRTSGTGEAAHCTAYD